MLNSFPVYTEVEWDLGTGTGHRELMKIVMRWNKSSNKIIFNHNINELEKGVSVGGKLLRDIIRGEEG